VAICHDTGHKQKRAHENIDGQLAGICHIQKHACARYPLFSSSSAHIYQALEHAFFITLVILRAKPFQNDYLYQ
jgi:hypothetical protein